MNKRGLKVKKISVVVPCYNEEDVINIFYKELKDTLDEIKDYSYENKNKEILDKIIKLLEE